MLLIKLTDLKNHICFFCFSDGIMDELLNPWSVHSIYDFSYYFCPECESKWQFKQGKLKLLKGIDNKTVRRLPPLLTLVHF